MHSDEMIKLVQEHVALTVQVRSQEALAHIDAFTCGATEAIHETWRCPTSGVAGRGKPDNRTGAEVLIQQADGRLHGGCEVTVFRSCLQPPIHCRNYSRETGANPGRVEASSDGQLANVSAAKRAVLAVLTCAWALVPGGCAGVAAAPAQSHPPVRPVCPECVVQHGHRADHSDQPVLHRRT